jgi:hypothetical protein
MLQDDENQTEANGQHKVGLEKCNVSRVCGLGFRVWFE